MVALEIHDIGALMNKMLKEEMFDHFLLQEASVSQVFSATIDGALRPEFFSAKEEEAPDLAGLSYIPFSRVRPLCLDLIRGKRKPDAFRFVFLLSPDNQTATIERAGTPFRTEDISGMFLNLSYRNETLTCTTGISYRTFSMDRSLEAEWDRMAALFFRQHDITVSEV